MLSLGSRPGTPGSSVFQTASREPSGSVQGEVADDERLLGRGGAEEVRLSVHEILSGRERQRSHGGRRLADRGEVRVRVVVSERRRAERDGRLRPRAVEAAVDGAELAARALAGVDRAARVGIAAIATAPSASSAVSVAAAMAARTGVTCFTSLLLRPQVRSPQLPTDCLTRATLQRCRVPGLERPLTGRRPRARSRRARCVVLSRCARGSLAARPGALRTRTRPRCSGAR